MKLRPYQRDAIDAVRARWDAGDPNALVVLATGLGKTIVFCTLGRELRMEGIGTTLVLAHRDELLDQARKKWLAVEPDAHVGIYQGARKENRADVICASVQSCYGDKLDDDGMAIRRGRIHDLPLERIGLIIVDECHRLCSPSYRAIIAAVREANPNALMLGVTATPARADGQGLGEFFDKASYVMGMSDGIAGGYLAPYIGQRVELDIDMSQIKTSKSTGDYNEDDLGHVMDAPDVRRAIASAWVEHAGPGTILGGATGRYTAAFCPTVDAARNLAETFKELGVVAEFVCGATKKADRHRIERLYQERKIQVLCNVGVYTEGWDAPHTDCILMARPTKSPVLYRQAVGRGTRLSPGKTNWLLMDCVGVNALGLQTMIDLSDARDKPEPEPKDEAEALEGEIVVGEKAKQLVLPDMAQTVSVRGCTVYEIDLFGGQVTWFRIRGMRLAILDRGLHVVIYAEPGGVGHTALLVDDTGASAIAKAAPEREALGAAEAVALARGAAKYLRPTPYQTRMQATENQRLAIQRLATQNEAFGGFDPADVPKAMSMPQAMAWIAYLKTRRMWMLQRRAGGKVAA